MPYDLNNFEKTKKDIKIGKVTVLDDEAAEKAYNFCINNLDTLTEYNQAYILMDGYTKILLNTIKSQSDEKTDAARNTEAYADNRMLTHNDNLAFAKARYDHLKELYNLAKERIGMWRTKEASSRI
jgi:nucleoside-specific outer membrane channel protein Tsx|tara:strand:- start:453 stop:830 length:378 start_codon:yes stop_codon:yes gene_type:complete